MAFENHWLIYAKLYQPTFNYPQFYIISYFVYCIPDYDYVVNYNIAYNEIMYKYFFKVFYNRINKIEYNV